MDRLWSGTSSGSFIGIGNYVANLDTEGVPIGADRDPYADADARIISEARFILAGGHCPKLIHSPYRNPIENAVAKLEAPLSEVAARTRDGLWDAVATAIDAFTRGERANCFTAAGDEPEW